jgi:hypothetical protein
MMARILAALLLCLNATGAWAQGALLQSGVPVNGDAPMYVGLGVQAVIGDSGPASGGTIPGYGLAQQLLVQRGTGTPPYVNAGTGPDGTNWCDYDASPAGGTGYHYLCIGPNNLGGALIETGAGGGAATQPLSFKINGTLYNFPAALSGVAGPASSTVNDIACWNNTTGSLLKDCGTASGTVTSVGLTMPNIFSVSGSPVTTSGTLAAALANENANTVFAGPNGSVGVPIFRSIVAADLGTQSANTFLAGPTSGAAVNPTWRTITGLDLPTPGATSLGGTESITCPTNQVMNLISTAGAPGCIQLGYNNLSGSLPPTQIAGAASGFVNKLRGTTLSQWYGGTTITVSTGLTWTAEGVGCLETGATITATQVSNPLTTPLSYYGLKLTGQTGNTDLQCRFVIESYDAAVLGSQTVTFQIPIQNNTGATLTPTITSKQASAGQDNWTSSATDLSTTNLQNCGSGSSCVEAYTFVVTPSAGQGYEVVIDFGAVGNGHNIVIGGGFDLRPTPGATVGLNSSPPAPEIYTVDRDRAWCSRFYQTSYANGVAPATSTRLGLVGGSLTSSTVDAPAAVEFSTTMRATPTMAYYDGAGTQNDYTGVPNNGGSTFTDGLAQGLAPFNASSRGFIVGYTSNTGYVAYTHYTADARLSGG